MDPRITKLAEILVNYSVKVKEGDVVGINSGVIARPLLFEVFKAVLNKGAFPLVKVLPFEELDEFKAKHGTDKQLEFIPESYKAKVNEIDCYIALRAPENLKTVANCDPQRLQISQIASRPYSNIIMSKRWTVCNYPTPALAQQANMSLEEYTDFLFNACNIDWEEVSKKQQKVVDALTGSRNILIDGIGTDLSFTVEGRIWDNCCGICNMPDGEVFTSPVEDSVNGVITFDLPTHYQGRKVEGVRLEYRNGQVVNASATANEDFLLKTLDTDDGSRGCGELAFGFNEGITQVTGDTLFDEKIGNTMHIAVGKSYPEVGGKNESAVHWDMVRTLSPGRVYVDGKILFKDGVWNL